MHCGDALRAKSTAASTCGECRKQCKFALVLSPHLPSAVHVFPLQIPAQQMRSGSSRTFAAQNPDQSATLRNVPCFDRYGEKRTNLHGLFAKCNQRLQGEIRWFCKFIHNFLNVVFLVTSIHHCAAARERSYRTFGPYRSPQPTNTVVAILSSTF